MEIIVIPIFLVPALAIMSYKYKIVHPFIRDTYFFWAIVSLYNLSLLSGLAMPVLLGFYSRFIGFLIIPTLIAITFCILLHYPALKKPVQKILNIKYIRIPTFVINFIFLVVFLISAEFYKDLLIRNALKKHIPACLEVKSILESIANGGDSHGGAHASFVENGNEFIWSFSKLEFIEISSPYISKINNCNTVYQQ